MAEWGDLARELDVWESEGRSVTFWWRDDDATRVTPALERLLAIGADAATPVGLAIIPRDADGALRDRLARHDLATALQHGWGHVNHAPAEDKQEEYGPHRPIDVMLDELAQGLRRIAAFAHALPVLVAPWNRIHAALLPKLPQVGLKAVSTWGPRDAADPAPGVRCANVHIDIVDWNGGRGFVGTEAALEQAIRHVRQRRAGEVDADEPTGLMTHHPFHDEGCWRFLAEFLQRTRAHRAVRWMDAREAFWP